MSECVLYSQQTLERVSWVLTSHLKLSMSLLRCVISCVFSTVYERALLEYPSHSGSILGTSSCSNCLCLPYTVERKIFVGSNFVVFAGSFQSTKIEPMNKMIACVWSNARPTHLQK